MHLDFCLWCTLELLKMSSAVSAAFERLCVSSVLSSCYDLAAYAMLSSLILKQSLLLVGIGEVGELGVKTGNLWKGSQIV